MLIRLEKFSHLRRAIFFFLAKYQFLTKNGDSLLATQSPMVFYFPCYHIQKCRSSKKVGRKDIILRFFFFPRDPVWKKKNRMGNRLFFFLCFITYICHLSNSWTGFTTKPNSKKLATVFFFPNPKSQRKKKT